MSFSCSVIVVSRFDGRAPAQAASPASFNPSTPSTISAMQPSRSGFADSPSSAMPSKAVPAAPTPVQTAYAVPAGSARIASASNQKLTAAPTITTTDGHSFENPSLYFSPSAQTISNSPATTSTAHA